MYEKAETVDAIYSRYLLSYFFIFLFLLLGSMFYSWHIQQFIYIDLCFVFLFYELIFVFIERICYTSVGLQFFNIFSFWFTRFDFITSFFALLF